MSAPILATKLYIPSPSPDIVSRPRLVERLNEGLARGCKLSLISAPAGFGKTTLVSEWIVGCERPAAWLSLDEGDSDPTRFLTYLIAALQKIKPGFGADLQAILQSPQPLQIENILTALLNEISDIQDNFLIILDDYHSIDSQQIDQSLIFLLKHQPPQMHLVITTREDPSLPLAQYRARGQLTEMRAADLRFTPTEAAEFLNHAMGLDLSEVDIAALEARTEGWIAGLQMAAISMQGHQDIAEFIQSFTGSHRFVLDYLLEEVLERQPVEVQTFLLQTSILDRMCGSLCDAVLLDPSIPGQATLEYIERANLFIIPLDDERRWYRYHHLFKDLLGQRLGEHCTAQEIAVLHIRASEWHETNGLMLAAFWHAAAANDVERAERLMESKAMGLHLRSVNLTILNWLDTLPAPVLDARPLLRVRSVTLALMSWRMVGIEEKLLAAEAAIAAALERSPLDVRVRDLSGQIACARATLALTRYDTHTMLTQARHALECLHPENHTFLFTANWAFASANLLLGNRSEAAQACQRALAFSQKSGSMFSRMLATSVLGNLQKKDNQLHKAAETYRHVLELAGDNPFPNAGQVHLDLAEIYYEWNDLEAAEQQGKQGQELMRQYGQLIDRFILGEVFIAHLQLTRGDVGGASDRLAEAEHSARQKNFLLRLPDIAAVQVLVLIQQGLLTKAQQLAQQYELPLSQAQVFIAQDDPSSALSILEPFRRQMEERGWADELLKAMVLQALALYEHDDKKRAVRLLDEAFVLAEPEGFIRLFVDEGPRMAKLLSAAAAEGIRPGYVNRLLAAFHAEQKEELISVPISTNRPAMASAMINPLSPREHEILCLIARGLSNKQISERLYLALDTVKGHNRKIFDKLNVKNRSEAITKAHELNLL